MSGPPLNAGERALALLEHDPATAGVLVVATLVAWACVFWLTFVTAPNLLDWARGRLQHRARRGRARAIGEAGVSPWAAAVVTDSGGDWRELLEDGDQ